MSQVIQNSAKTVFVMAIEYSVGYKYNKLLIMLHKYTHVHTLKNNTNGIRFCPSFYTFPSSVDNMI